MPKPRSREHGRHGNDVDIAQFSTRRKQQKRTQKQQPQDQQQGQQAGREADAPTDAVAAAAGGAGGTAAAPDADDAADEGGVVSIDDKMAAFEDELAHAVETKGSAESKADGGSGDAAAAHLDISPGGSAPFCNGHETARKSRK